MKQFDLDKSVEDYEEELYEELRFDKYDLDNEYEEQPRKFMDWAILYGKALTLRKRKESALDKVKGKIDLDIRKNPKVFGLEPDSKGKIMETAIKSVINTHKDVIAAEEEFYKVYGFLKLFEHAVESFKQRKELLRGEGELWINKYYASRGLAVGEREAVREDTRETIEDDLQSRVPSKRRILK